MLLAMNIGQAIAHAVERLSADERLDELADPTADAVRHALDRQPLKDVLSGSWLGHPLHPLLTDLPIGFWTSAFTLDLVGGRSTRRAATQLVAWGVIERGADCPRRRSRLGRHHWSRAPGGPRARRRQHHRAGVLRRVVVVAGTWSPRAWRRARARGRHRCDRRWISRRPSPAEPRRRGRPHRHRAPAVGVDPRRRRGRRHLRAPARARR